MNEEILENPVTGESMKVLESTQETFKFQYTLKPHARIAGVHFHPNQEQVNSVVSGELHLKVNGVHHIVRAGESLTVPAGAHHFQWNPNNFETVVIEAYHPAGHLHDFFRVLFGLAKDGKTNSKGYPPIFIAAAMVTEFKDSILPAPLALRFLIRLLSPVALALGYARMLDKYRRSA